MPTAKSTGGQTDKARQLTHGGYCQDKSTNPQQFKAYPHGNSAYNTMVTAAKSVRALENQCTHRCRFLGCMCESWAVGNSPPRMTKSPCKIIRNAVTHDFHRVDGPLQMRGRKSIGFDERVCMAIFCICSWSITWPASSRGQTYGSMGGLSLCVCGRYRMYIHRVDRILVP